MNTMYETDKFILTPLTKEIAFSGNYTKWFHDPDVTKHNSHGLFPYTKKGFDSFIENIESGEGDFVLAIMSIELPGQFTRNTKKEFKHIGNISLQRINWYYRSAEFAIIIGEKNYWGKGYGYEASKLLFNHAFNKLNMHRVWTGTSATNTGMQKLAIKLGMQREAIFRDGIFLDGKYYSIYQYAILENEWRKKDE